MTVLKILSLPDLRLRQICSPVEDIQAENISSLLNNMWDTMYEHNGIGLAAPQIGVNLRVIVAHVPLDKDGEEFASLEMINPEILWKSAALTVFEEGCLSVPGFFAQVERSLEIRVNFWSREGVKKEAHLEGLPAVCIQHEIDHLNGIVFVDYLDAETQKEALLKLEASNA